ncbi:hypothetical protein [Lactobacillus sp. Sy-1]|uniref:hypothetical protein n=1 Tax=Lactobacillus sp. Sy-1 TaxID=2109645 RepID=UPI001C5AAD3B|nr:hypothetical protein [Lactobacillus sp. Sy-1]MBW1606077.1 hypothetical protein [Lactobacillus sp. Sy-1]
MNDNNMSHKSQSVNAISNDQEEVNFDGLKKIIKATQIELYLDSIKLQEGIGL